MWSWNAKRVNRRSILRGALVVSAALSLLGCVEPVDGVAEAEQEVTALAVPAPPADLSAESMECFGFYFLNWSYSDGATYYELYRLTPTQAVAYSGGDVGIGVNIGNQSRSFAVKACNSEGCSSLGSSLLLSPWPSCD
jgi:hypothetical protein